MENLSLGDRMKSYYEKVQTFILPMRMPVILRLDGKAFHTFTKKFEKPFDENLMDAMDATALYLCENIQGAQVAYIQSDEISIFVHNYKKFNSQSWFGNEVQKMVSVSAGMASAKFTVSTALMDCGIKPVVFDSRVFVIPENEVCNYFIWRQQDWERNSIQMLAQSLYSHKDLHKKLNSDMQEMCFKKGKNWNDLSTKLKRGRCIIKSEGSWIIDNEIPIFTKEREYINKLLVVEEE